MIMGVCTYVCVCVWEYATRNEERAGVSELEALVEGKDRDIRENQV